MGGQLKKFLLDVVNENKVLGWDGAYYLSLDKLSSHDISKFIVHLLIDDDQGLCCLSENKAIDELTKSFYEMIRDPDLDNKLYFSDLVLTKTYEYYSLTMQRMIDEILEFEC